MVLSPNACSSIDSFLSCENQFHRKDYEMYLQSLQNHIHAQLLKIQDAQSRAGHKIPASLSPSLQSEGLTPADNDRIERENFIVEHAKKYWVNFPFATLPMVFNDYTKVCSSRLRYAQTKWKEIIKSNSLDPRTPEKKKLAAGRKPKTA